MELIFLGVLIAFTISTFEFQVALTLSLMISGPNSPNLSQLDYGLLDLEAMLESYHKLQQKPKTVSEFKNALQLIWFALPEKPIDNTVKDHYKRLQACVATNGRHIEHFM